MLKALSMGARLVRADDASSAGAAIDVDAKAKEAMLKTLENFMLKRIY